MVALRAPRSRALGQRRGRLGGLARRRSVASDRGSIVLEFALLVPIVLCLIIGAIWGALAFADYDSAMNAVREAARYGAAADVSSPQWATSVRTRLQETYFDAGRTATDDEICVALENSSGTVLQSAYGSSCGSAPTLPAGLASGSCAVVVWLQKPESIALGIFPGLKTHISASSVESYGRTVDDSEGTPICTA